MRHFLAVIIALVLVILVMLFSGCTGTRHTTETETVTTETQTPEIKSVVHPVYDGKRYWDFENDRYRIRVTIPQAFDVVTETRTDSATGAETTTTRKTPRAQRAGDSIGVDLTQKPQTQTTKQSKVTDKAVDNPPWYEGYTKLFLALAALILVCGVVWRFVIKR
jgi:hypothetical protein